MSGRRLFWVVLPLLLVALAAEIGRARRLLQASRILKAVEAVAGAAEQAHLEQRNPAAYRGLLEKGVEQLRLAGRLHPAEVRVPLFRGALYSMLGRPQAAIRAYEEARDQQPRGEIYARLGDVYLQIGQREKALEAYRSAVFLDHNLRKRYRSYLAPPRRQRTPSREKVFSDGFETGDWSAWDRRSRPEEPK